MKENLMMKKNTLFRFASGKEVSVTEKCFTQSCNNCKYYIPVKNKVNCTSSYSRYKKTLNQTKNILFFSVTRTF